VLCLTLKLKVDEALAFWIGTLSNIRIGTRGSKLAMWQAEWVAGQLTQRGHAVELITISTKGDVSTQSLSAVGGQGLFTKEIQRELLAGNVDLAVHSLKDLPTQTVPGLSLTAVPQRETTEDCLISRDGKKFEALPTGARIGTGSSRRGAQLLAWRPDVQIADIRGNVDSRLRKLEEAKYDAIILAAAGLTRLKLLQHVTELLPQDRILPAIGQGALGLECRQEDESTIDAVLQLNDPDSFAAVTAERSLLASLLAGCLAPVAALATVRSNQLTLQARVCATDGSRMIEGTHGGLVEEAELIGADLAERLRADGAEELIALARR
jgi:hydroxymethylbilane synthase